MTSTPEPVHTFATPGEGPRVQLNLTLNQIGYLVATHGLAIATITARKTAESQQKFISMMHAVDGTVLAMGREETIALGETLMRATESICPEDASDSALEKIIAQLEASGAKVIKLKLD